MKKLFVLFVLFLSFQMYGQEQLQSESVNFLQFTSNKVIQLSEAIPADTYNWAPEEGVRTFAQIFAHIISANYFFGSKLGAEVPSEIDMQSLEKNLDTKEEIQKALQGSYDFIFNAIKETPYEVLSDKVEYPFPGEYTNMSSILISMSHSNEHLGQLIAYSRMNGITPPWSE
ncbi:DinB family protein [Membranihabitans maritimus]|uniref:DinB family protein n=1 Tax=Membranihabitans maritimus TaxID=2904244 RepID=UPI001F2B3195|nr:DinB family protein [Membranihabitans maritimus]